MKRIVKGRKEKDYIYEKVKGVGDFISRLVHQGREEVVTGREER